MAEDHKPFENRNRKTELLVKLSGGKRNQLDTIAIEMEITPDRLASQIIEVWLIDYEEMKSGSAFKK